jgi:hypothetical protein
MGQSFSVLPGEAGPSSLQNIYTTATVIEHIVACAGPLPQHRAGHGPELLSAAWQGGPLQPAEHLQGAPGRLRLHSSQARRLGKGESFFSMSSPGRKHLVRLRRGSASARAKTGGVSMQ